MANIGFLNEKKVCSYNLFNQYHMHFIFKYHVSASKTITNFYFKLLDPENEKKRKMKKEFDQEKSNVK